MSLVAMVIDCAYFV